MCLYLDESGELGFSERSSKFFVITILRPKNKNEIYRVIKKIRQRKLKKRIEQLSEIKANNSDDFIRRKVLEGIAKADCEIYCIVLNKKAVREYLRLKKKKLYNYLSGIIVTECPVTNGKIRLIVDRRETNSIFRKDFDQYMESRVKQADCNARIEVTHMNSENEKCLQAADFIAWAIYRKYENSDDTFYSIIEGRIKVRHELFL